MYQRMTSNINQNIASITPLVLIKTSGSKGLPVGNYDFGTDTLLAESLRSFLDKSTYLGRSKETLFAGYGTDGTDQNLAHKKNSLSLTF